MKSQFFFYLHFWNWFFFDLIFFGQNVLNENICTLWFPFSSAAGFLSLLHQTRGGTGSSCTVRGSAVLWKKPRPTGLAWGTTCAGGSLARRRRKGPGTDSRESGWHACITSFRTESNFVATCWALQLRFEQPPHGCARRTSSCVRKPTVPSCCWDFVSFVVVNENE